MRITQNEHLVSTQGPRLCSHLAWVKVLDEAVWLWVDIALSEPHFICMHRPVRSEMNCNQEAGSAVSSVGKCRDGNTCQATEEEPPWQAGHGTAAARKRGSALVRTLGQEFLVLTVLALHGGLVQCPLPHPSLVYRRPDIH